MKLPAFFTTVTPFSKLLALFLFILLPIIGFSLGMWYQKIVLLNDLQFRLDLRQLTPTPIVDSSLPQKPISSDETEAYCNENGGTFLYELNERNKYMECENISQDACAEIGGIFEECMSACRHLPETEACVEMCVPVCSL